MRKTENRRLKTNRDPSLLFEIPKSILFIFQDDHLLDIVELRPKIVKMENSRCDVNFQQLKTLKNSHSCLNKWHFPMFSRYMEKNMLATKGGTLSLGQYTPFRRGTIPATRNDAILKNESIVFQPSIWRCYC